jgi:hypothetical protein
MSSDLQIASFMQGGLVAQPEDGSRASKAKIEQAWLRELERAQLEQLSAGNARNGGSSSDRHASKATMQSGEARHAGRQGAPEPGLGRNRADDRPSQTAPAPGNRRNQGIAVTQRLVAKGEARSGLPASGEKAATVPKRSPAWEAVIEQHLWSEARRWERRKAFVLERGGRIKVWLRDSDLESSPLEEIVASIGHLFREAGMEVDEITINGRIVFSSQLLGQQHGFLTNYRE